MKRKFLSLCALLFAINLLITAQVQRIEINTASIPANAEIKLKLVQRFQQYNKKTVHSSDRFDTTINSPSRSIFSTKATNFTYIHLKAVVLRFIVCPILNY
jgi:hypothetical protein